MPIRNSLRLRVLTTFTLLGVGISAMFAVGSVWMLEEAERLLAGESMRRQIEFMAGLEREDAALQLDAQTYYVTNLTTAWPERFNHVADGFHENLPSMNDRHIFVLTQDGVRHALITTLDEFEEREEQFERVALIGFMISSLMAFVLGSLVARRVIAPVTLLARQVRHRDKLLTKVPALAPDYADDEVGQLAQAFDETLEKLNAALTRAQLFSSDASHELRTPLMVIMSSCELLLANESRPAADARQLKRMARAATEMHELVEALLSLVRTPGERSDCASNSLAELAREQLARFSDEAQRRDIALGLDGVADALLNFPAPLMRVVMGNLVRNALHYTDRGFVTLRLHLDGFSVIDSGVGVSPEIRERIFEPFVRGDRSRGDGIGIGLSLVQRICSQQGWRISLNSPEAGGCEFRVVLPGN